MRSVFTFLSFFPFLFGFGKTIAQGWTIDTLVYEPDYYDVGRGLSQSLVSSIRQDSSGFLWIGTKDGLNRFDGNEFRVYRSEKDNPFSLKCSHINDLLIDQNHRMWISTSTGGLHVRDPEIDGFRPVLNDKGEPVEDTEKLILNKEGRMITIAGNMTIGKVLIIQETLSDTLRVKEVPVCEYYSGLRKFGICSKQPTGFTYYHFSRFTSRAGNYYHVIENGMIACFDLPALKGEQPPSILKLPESYNAERDSVFFFENPNTEEVFFHYNGNEIYRCDESAQGYSLYCFLPVYRASENYHFFDRSGFLWLRVGKNRIARIDREQKKIKLILAGERLNGMTSPFEDRQGNIWFMSNGMGLGKIPVNYDLFNKLSHDPYIKIGIWSYRFEMPDKKATFSEKYHNLWLHHENHLLDSALELREETHQFQLFINSRNYVWLPWHDPISKTTKFSAFNLRLEDAAEANLPLKIDTEFETVNSAFSWRGDTMAVFSRQMGELPELTLYHPDVGIIRTYQMPIDRYMQKDRLINDWLIDYPDGIWMGTTEGLYHLNIKTAEWKVLNNEDNDGASLLNKNVLSISSDSYSPDSLLWLGTPSGLHHFNFISNQIEYLTTEDGLPNNVIYGIQEDEHGYLWMGTNFGLSRFDPDTKTFVNFTSKDGLYGNEFNRFQFSKSDNGTLFFGGIEGTTEFNPSRVLKDVQASTLVFQKLLLFNEPVDYLPQGVASNEFRLPKPLDQTNELVFDYDQKMITLKFSLVDFGDVSKHKYRYRLLGLNEQWIEIQGKGEATYTNLTPGEYTFEVLGRNSQFVWSEKPTVMKMTILPPWWGTWGFRILFVVIIIGAVYGIYRYRVNSLLKVERTRNRIAEDLHDEIGSTLSSVSLYGSVLKSTSDNLSPQSQSIIDKITTNTSEMMEKMNDMVWTIKTDNDSMEKVVNRMRAFAVQMTEPIGMELKFESDEKVDNLELAMDKRKELYLFFKEAVNNAAKYSKSTSLRISLHRKDQGLKLVVNDDGIGFDPDQKTEDTMSGNGLKTMEARARRLRSQLKIHSVKGEGTSVILIIPKTH